MKALKQGFVKRALSVILTLLMILSLCTAGIVSSSAADVDLSVTGASRTFAAGDYIYIKNFTPSGWSANWFANDVYEWMHIWNSSTNYAIDVQFELIEGTENAVGAIYGAKITTAGTYDMVIFSRSHSSTTPWDNQNQTGNIPLDATNNCYTNLVVGGTSYSGSVYTPSGSGSDTPAGEGVFWVDLDGDSATTIDRIYASEDFKESDNYNHDVYFICLPSSVKTQYDAGNTTVKVFCGEGDNLTIDGTTISSDGTDIDLATLSSNPALGGDFSGNVYFKLSANVSSVHTTTSVSVPEGTYQGYENKDDFETKGSIVVLGPDGTQKNEDTILKKIKGRGNSSWEASHKIIGKYAFNITLEEKAKLLDESAKSKKYCLVSYNADEARMRNMIVYELAQQIGTEFAPDFEPVDFYNNGYYIGTYLLTDKVEIGNPLVDLDVNLDDVNEMLGTVDKKNGPWGVNYGLYDDDSLMNHTASNGNLDDTSTVGYYKYISNLEEPDSAVYKDSGFLLEFELNERFNQEISGFISNRGQQIVCKYPEYATKNEIQYIMGIWNEAEADMYNPDATYAMLDEHIDVESFAKMYLIQELTKNLDGGATSYYVYYDGGKLHAGVAWDYDWTLGQYAKEYTDRVNTKSDFYDQVDADPSESGGWYLNSKTIYGGSDFNAQAALCQNDAFWSVVTAEWNEIFHEKATTFTDSTVSSVSQLDGILAQYYNMVKATTIMDELKWGLIASDPFITNNWGSQETGDTHDDAVVWLNNWMYERITWMDKYLNPDNNAYPNKAPYNVDYIIQPPTVSFDKALYQAGETATLIIDDKTDGNYTYTIYKDGVQVATTDSKEYTFTAVKSGIGNYTVVAASDSSQKVSAASNAAPLAIEGLNIVLNVEAPVSVGWNDVITVKGSTNADADYDVTYTFTVNGENVTADGSTLTLTTGYSEIGETISVTVTATVVDGEDTLTATKTVDIAVTDYSMTATLSSPPSVEAGMTIRLTSFATHNTGNKVTYEFYENGTLVEVNNTGVYTIETTQADLNTERTYYVIAKTTVVDSVNGTEYNYSATTASQTVSITEVKEIYDVTIYFKSTSTLAYRPILTTTGAVNDLADYSMQKDVLLESTGKNSSQSATYYWYRADVTVSKASPSLSISILSSRYAMEGDITLTITDSGAVYLGVDNLNYGSQMVNMTDWTEDERNWTQSALHMVYDAEIDQESLASVSAQINLAYVGDANGDGTVNIKDATLIQKFLANLESLTAFSKQASDVNDDGRITIKDATAIQKKIAACL